MAFGTHPGEPLGDGLRRLYDEQVALARAHLAAPDDDGVHEARKAGKRLRSLLRFVRAAVPADWRAQTSARVRIAGRLLAPSRDAAVLVEMLDALPSDRRVDRRSTRRVHAALVEQHARLASSAQLAESAAAADWLLATVQGGLPPLPDDLDVLLSGARRTYRRGRRRADAARAAPSAHALHEWRKRAKDLWHLTQMLRGAWPAVLDPWAEQAHQLSDALGDHHDLAVLAGALGLERHVPAAAADPLGPALVADPPAASLGVDPADPPLTERGREGLAVVVAERQRDHLRRALALGAVLHAERPGAWQRRMSTWQAAAHGGVGSP